MVQLFTASPSTWTTQAPHCEVSQPTWVPVRLRFSRKNWTSSVRSLTSAVTSWPFTVIRTVTIYQALPCGLTRRLQLLRQANVPPVLETCAGGRIAARQTRVPAPRLSRQDQDHYDDHGKGDEAPGDRPAEEAAPGGHLEARLGVLDRLLNAIDPSLRRRRLCRRCSRRGRQRGGCRLRGRAKLLGEAAEELVRHLLGARIDEAAAKLGELAADGRIRLIFELRAA